MRRNAKVDSNQVEIVAALRRVGASVAHTHMVGDGFPDIIVGYRGHNYMVEIKDGSKKPSAQKLTDDEKDFHKDWLGTIHIVNGVDSALEMIGAIK